VTRRRTMLISTALLLAVLLGASFLPPCIVRAEASCSSQCKAAYGACYKSSQDRSKCQAQLQRCLESCLRSRRGH